jgi:hypothetical protein
MVKLSFFLAVRCVLANVTQNYKDTWQSHNGAVCFSKRQKITVSCNKFSFFYSLKELFIDRPTNILIDVSNVNLEQFGPRQPDRLKTISRCELEKTTQTSSVYCT